MKKIDSSMVECPIGQECDFMLINFSSAMIVGINSFYGLTLNNKK
ncbi:hypothetical protein [Bacteroides acidifaciens]